jgi:hypothetical protein
LGYELALAKGHGLAHATEQVSEHAWVGGAYAFGPGLSCYQHRKPHPLQPLQEGIEPESTSFDLEPCKLKSTSPKVVELLASKIVPKINPLQQTKKEQEQEFVQSASEMPEKGKPSHSKRKLGGGTLLQMPIYTQN